MSLHFNGDSSVSFPFTRNFLVIERAGVVTNWEKGLVAILIRRIISNGMKGHFTNRGQESKEQYGFHAL